MTQKHFWQVLAGMCIATMPALTQLKVVFSEVSFALGLSLCKEPKRLTDSI